LGPDLQAENRCACLRRRRDGLPDDFVAKSELDALPRRHRMVDWTSLMFATSSILPVAVPGAVVVAAVSVV
jgi:hypothetical protein